MPGHERGNRKLLEDVHPRAEFVLTADTAQLDLDYLSEITDTNKGVEDADEDEAVHSEDEGG